MKRRQFIKATGTASTLIATVPIVSSFNVNQPHGILGSSDRPNLAVIGTGVRGKGMIPIFQANGFNVVACCDVLDFRLKSAVEKTKEINKGKKIMAVSDYRKILEDQSIDAVYIATTFSMHDEIAIASMQAGKHIFCEKALAKGDKNILKMTKAYQNFDKVFQSGHQYHASNFYKYAVQLIQEGELGQILSFECQWNRWGNWRRKVDNPALERQINWRMYKEFSGGLIAELCSHQIDFCNWVTGDTPTKVMGLGGIDYWKDGRETFDNVHVLYEYPKGIKAKFTCLTANAKDDYQVKVQGSKGTMILKYHHGYVFPEGKYTRKSGNVDGVSGATASWVEGKGYPLPVKDDKPSATAASSFRQSIIDKKNPISNFKMGALAAICVDMGFRAVHENKPIKWKDKYDLVKSV